MCAIGKSMKRHDERMVQAWKVFSISGGVLQPQFKVGRYVTGVVYAAVHADSGVPRAPTKTNKVGFYAFSTREAAKRETQWQLGRTYRKVTLFGTIIQHETGYRGEFMMVHERRVK